MVFFVVVVFLWWCSCGDVFCGGVFVLVFFVVLFFVVVFLCWCSGVFVLV